MIVETTDKEIIFKIPADTNIKELQKIYDFFKKTESNQSSQAIEDEKNILVKEPEYYHFQRIENLKLLEI